MILRRPRGSWLAAGVIVLWAGLAPPALASHVAPADTKDAQAGPLKLGVSGSSQTFLLIKNVLYCYAGTLGSLVQDSVADRYILSNNHVLAKENEEAFLYRDMQMDAVQQLVRRLSLGDFTAGVPASGG